MLVTVSICTWNRAALLDQTLTRMQSLQIPSGVDWELLVVNNNCTDETDRVLEKHSSILPLRRLFQPQPGLSHARNLVLDSAQGDLLLWSDDDVLVDPCWVSAYLDAARTWPDAAFFGGPIEAWFEVEPPKWIRDNLDLLRSPYAVKNLADLSRPLRCGETIFGANMAFRRDRIDGLTFDVKLGPSPNSEVRGEETEFISELIKRGSIGVWVATAPVKHFIPEPPFES